MKKILFSMVCFAIALTVGAQQQGVNVRTLEKANRPSQGLEGVTVNILEYPNTLVSKKGGKLSFSISGKKQGDSFKVSRVQKKGYTLADKLLIGRKYSYSATVPIEIVMVSDKQLAQDKKLVEDKAYAKAKKTYETRIAELERKLNEKTISEQAFYAERERLSDDYDSYVKLIGDMAERYAMTDYKGLSDINREILQCIENAELERADSLINSKGDFDKREQELRSQMELNQATAEFLAQSQHDAEVKLNDLAEDYYNKFTILSAKYQNDSAAYYLMRRAALDTTKVQWQNEAAGFIRDYLADYELALDYFQLGLNQAIVQYGEQSEWAAWSFYDIGEIYYFQGDLALAMEFFQKSLSIFGTEHPDVPLVYNRIGNIHLGQGNEALAMECYQKALTIGERLLGTEHPYVAGAYNNIAEVYYNNGDFAQALEYSQKSLSIREKFLGTEDPEVAASYDNIGILYSSLGDFTKAMDCYQKALAITEQVFGTIHPDIALTYDHIGTLYSRQGDFAKGLEYLKKALDIRERVYGTEHLSVGKSYSNIGRNYYEQGDIIHALEYYKKSLDIFEQTLGSDDHLTQQLKTLVDLLNLKKLMGI
ncbi:MAG: tetratricopeptide repeat protein [Muribaculaceae bacterium]|nr:tetratricopeptide repeat protein [Muribaculaceae bacterium]